MANPEHLKIRLLIKIISYIFYVIGFSFFYSILSDLQASLSFWFSGITENFSFNYTVSELILHARFAMFYTICQVIAAVITVRGLSLRKLFYFSCIFVIVGQFISFFEFRMMKLIGGLFFPLFLIGHLLPYVAPVLILALINRKKTMPESESDVEKKTVSIPTESKVAIAEKIKVVWYLCWYFYSYVPNHSGSFIRNSNGPLWID